MSRWAVFQLPNVQVCLYQVFFFHLLFQLHICVILCNKNIINYDYVWCVIGFQCGQNEVPTECEKLRYFEESCARPHPPVGKLDCIPGCRCRDYYVRFGSRCVLKAHCRIFLDRQRDRKAEAERLALLNSSFNSIAY